MLTLEKKIDKAERVCSAIAMIPVIGTVAGTLKALGGGIQVISAIGAQILLFPAALIMWKHKSLSKHAWTHMQHGCGNILAGTFEAIPLIGTILAGMRNSMKHSDQFIPFAKHQKFMPYQSLVEDDKKNHRMVNLWAKV